MEGKRWTTSDWKTETENAMVVSFLQYCPLAELERGDAGLLSKPRADDLVVFRFEDSYMNHVICIRVKILPATGFIVKMAPACMQCPGVALEAPVERGEMEYRAYEFFSKIVPDCVPRPVFYDSKLHILCTRELTGYNCLTEELLCGRFSVPGIRSLAMCLASLHSATHVITLGKKGMDELRQQFPVLEPMVNLIRVFHYERPFDPADPGKRCAPEVLQILPGVYCNSAVKAANSKVIQYFVQRAECLIHGDLHIDSVIVKGDDFKMVDAEFVRIGPCAYDVGLLLATLVLIFQYQRHADNCFTTPQSGGVENEEDFAKKDLGFSRQVSDSLGGTLLQNTNAISENQPGLRNDQADGGATAEKTLAMISELLHTYSCSLTEKLRQEEDFSKKLVQDIAAFAGCEILSCVIGPSHFEFLDASPAAQVKCVQTAVAVLQKLDHITEASELVDIIAQ